MQRNHAGYHVIHVDFMMSPHVLCLDSYLCSPQREPLVLERPSSRVDADATRAARLTVRRFDRASTGDPGGARATFGIATRPFKGAWYMYFRVSVPSGVGYDS